MLAVPCSLSTGDLVQNLAAAGQEVPPMLHELAARDPRFRKVQPAVFPAVAICRVGAQQSS